MWNKIGAKLFRVGRLRKWWYDIQKYWHPIIKRKGRYDYTVVSALYNVEAYLDDYFESIVSQTLDFKRHIRLVLIDDGSTDSTVQIVRDWQARYPDNIVLIQKENGGQASARNIGLEYVQSPWVTFIDPDDFVDYRYFERVDHALKRYEHKPIGLVSCNFIFYFEEKRTFEDTHPLRYRFRYNERLVYANDMRDMIQLNVNSLFFKTELVLQSGLHFEETLRPNFEDGHFVNRYLLQNPRIGVLFLKKAYYFYRKRTTLDSSLDTSWHDERKYTTILQNGYLDLLQEARARNGNVPMFIQRTVLYELGWYLQYLFRNDPNLHRLTPAQRACFIQLFKTVCSYIDSTVIDTFEIPHLTLMHKIGLMQWSQGEPPQKTLCRIDAYDPHADAIRLVSYHTKKAIFECFVGRQSVQPIAAKRIRHTLAQTFFVDETILWVPLQHKNTTFRIQTKTEGAFVLNGRIYQNGDLTTSHIRQAFKKRFQTIFKLIPPWRDNGIWLFIDTVTRADDNAESLYRYVAKHRPDLSIGFVLKKGTPDWYRLRNEGFNLIKYGSLRHVIALLKARHLVSSSIDHPITDLIPRRYFHRYLGYRFTFLQHGIILHDLSAWLNTKSIDCFITSTHYEYNAITQDDTAYRLTTKETVLTGLARHDALLSDERQKSKTILIFPTWRLSLFQRDHKTGTLLLRHDFKQSFYFKQWYSLLNDERLHRLAQRSGYRICFIPHPMLTEAFASIRLPSSITLYRYDEPMRRLFQECSVFVTDYSSSSVDAAFLQRAIIYFQFDQENFFNGNHTSKQGYFDYERDGFGPVCTTKEEFLSALESIVNNGGVPSIPYKNRMQTFFAYRDGHNCKRILKAIEQMGS